MRLVLAGASVRALAQSAAAAGAEVLAVDAYGDTDLRAVASWHPVPGGARWTPARAARAAASLAATHAAWVASFENHPRALAGLATGRVLIGNTAAVVQRVRDPRFLPTTLRAAGLPALDVRLDTAPLAGAWLRKPRRSGGGHGILRWRPGLRLRPGQHLQREVTGVPGSFTFAADGTRVVPLALSRMLVGEPATGARGFRYAGSVVGPAPLLGFDEPARLLAQLFASAEALTRAGGLVGVNGIDFVAADGVAWPVELNPRPTAAMELVERATGWSVFAAHEAGSTGRLATVPDVRLDTHALTGKAIVYASVAARAPDLAAGELATHVADVPAPGTRVGRGAPVCTVFAEAACLDACLASLHARAAHVRDLLQFGSAPDYVPSLHRSSRHTPRPHARSSA